MFDAARSVDTSDAATTIDDLGARLRTAAAEVFAERGYDRAGVAEIARRAGVTTGAIYSRYRGKAELLVEAIDPQATDELELLFANHDFAGRMEDILVAAGTQLVKRGPEDRVHTSLLFEAFVAARRHPEVGALLRGRVAERQQRLLAIVEAAKADGGIAADVDTDSVVAFCQALAFGFLLFDATGLAFPTPGPWEDLITRLVETLGAADATEQPTARGN